MQDPLESWEAFLRSPDAPKEAMSVLELDGFLTGVVVCPQAAPIMPNRWLPKIWGEGGSAFESIDTASAALSAAMGQYNSIIARLRLNVERLKAKKDSSYRPAFLPVHGKPDHDAVRSWCRGFFKAMSLAPRAWLDAGDSENGALLIRPLAAFMNVEGDDDVPGEIAGETDLRLDTFAEMIPRVIVLLYQAAKRHGRPVQMPSVKTGRNEPCPCGSGKKYKRCCGAGPVFRPSS